MMAIQIINPITYPGWDELLLSTPGHSFFHSSSWAKVLHESYNYTPVYFSIIDGGHLLALIPIMEVNSFLTGKRGVSLPFTDYSEPITNGNVCFPDLFNEIINFGKKHNWKYIEFRGKLNYSILSPQSSVLNPYITYLGHTLATSQDTDHIFSRFRDSTKRNIKRAWQKRQRSKCRALWILLKNFTG
jgi:hypothetical protein